MDHYGSETPPNYDLGQVTAPTAIFFGENDDLVTILFNYNALEALIVILANIIFWLAIIHSRPFSIIRASQRIDLMSD